jgi:hypothetical protein
MREMELWRVRKDGRELRCVAVYLLTGIDLRLMEDGESKSDAVMRRCPDLALGQRRLSRQACPGRA